MPPAARATGAIRFGLAAIKNVGEIAVEAIVSELKKGGRFKSLDDLCERVDLRVVNRKVLETLVKCGACDSLGPERASASGRPRLFADVEYQMNRASSLQRDRDRGQAALFDVAPVNARRRPASAR